MTTTITRNITIFIFIIMSVSFEFSVSQLKGTGPNSVCNMTKSMPIEDGPSYKKSDKTSSHDLLENERIDPIFFGRIQRYKLVVTSVCCAGYEDIEGTCTPQCTQINCTNGYCARPNICECNFGWGGNSCDKLLFCTLAQPLSKDFSDPMKKYDRIDVAEVDLVKFAESACLPECGSQISSTSFKFTESGNTTYHFFPIHAPCNRMKSDSKLPRKYMYLIGAVISIIILTLIFICILCMKLKKSRARDPAELESEYGGEVQENIYYEYVDLDKMKP